MLGLGEEDTEIAQVMRDLRAHDCDMLTLGQYLQPSRDHLPVRRYVSPEQFARFGELAESLGFAIECSLNLAQRNHRCVFNHDVAVFLKENHLISIL